MVGSKLLYASVVLLLAWLGQGLHPTYLASTALLLTLYFGALLFAGDLYFAVLFQYLPLAVGRLLSAASALTLLPAAQGALVGVPVALVLAVPPVLAVHVSKLKRSILIFAMTWSVVQCLAARTTPLGHFASWQGSAVPNLYWISSTLGPPGLDFFQALLAASLAHLAAAATSAVEPRYRQTSLIDEDESERQPLLPRHGDNDTQNARSAALKARKPAFILLGLVLLLSLPSSHLQYSTSTYRVGCALPQEFQQDLAGYLQESLVSASRGARVILWPEAAVPLSSEKELRQFENELFAITYTYGCHIGATYALKRHKKFENTFTLMGPQSNIPIITYSKQHLLPFVESFPTHRGHKPAPHHEFDVPLKSFCRSHRHDRGELSVVPQIGHDTSFPVWTKQTPSLLLVPAGVPDASIGEARLDELKERSRETNSAVLFCDASARGTSGLLDQRGWVKTLQFGGQGTFEADVPFQTHTRSPPMYAQIGDQGSLAALLVGVIILQMLSPYIQDGSAYSFKAWAGKGQQMLQSHVRTVTEAMPFGGGAEEQNPSTSTSTDPAQINT